MNHEESFCSQESGSMISTRGGEPAARVIIWYGPHQNFRYPI